MSLWLRIRGELAGAWRSVRYDLGRRPDDRTDGPDVTSTGLSTFPGSLMEWRTGAPETDAKPPRRFVAVTALCLLALAGAIGSYLLVTRGLASAGDQPLAAPAPPPVETPVDAETSPASDKIGPAAGRKPARPRTTAAADTPTSPTKADIPESIPHRPTARRPPVTTPECDCVTPPVPTPTAPASSHDDSPDPGVSASGSPSGSANASTDPSPSVSDSNTDGERQPGRRHWQKAG